MTALRFRWQTRSDAKVAEFDDWTLTVTPNSDGTFQARATSSSYEAVSVSQPTERDAQLWAEARTDR